MDIVEAKEFILFCIEHNILDASYKELKFVRTVPEVKITEAPKQFKVPSDEELLFGTYDGKVS